MVAIVQIHLRRQAGTSSSGFDVLVAAVGLDISQTDNNSRYIVHSGFLYHRISLFAFPYI